MNGIPAASEDILVSRDLILAEYTGGPLHIAHTSTKGAVRLIRGAKARGVRVTAEVCPHHLVLTEEAVRGFDTNTKMKPPLRTEEDRQALLEALKDGTIDAIATDHAPHAYEEKETEYDAAAFGIIGLETAVGLMFTHLVKRKILSLEQLVEKMAVIPRKILNLPENAIRTKATANLTILNPNHTWRVDKSLFLSKSRNTPFDGAELACKSMGVVNKGQIFYDRSLQKESVR